MTRYYLWGLVAVLLERAIRRLTKMKTHAHVRQYFLYQASRAACVALA